MAIETLRPPPENIISRETVQNPYQRRKTWLRKAIAEGTLNKSRQKHITAGQWSRMVDIGLKYCLNDDFSLLDLAKLHGLKNREKVRQLKNRFLRRVWNACSKNLQEEYPFDTIPRGKPRSQRFREKQSESQGGTSLRVKELLEQGKGLKQIQNELNISSSRLGSTRRILENWGYNLPRIRTKPYKLK